MAGGGRGRQGRPAHPGALTHAPPTGSHWEREPIEERKSPQVKSSCHGDGGCVLGPLSATDQGPQDVDALASKRELVRVQGEPEAHQRRRPEDSLETQTGALRAVETTRQEHESAAGPLGESLFRDGNVTADRDLSLLRLQVCSANRPTRRLVSGRRSTVELSERIGRRTRRIQARPPVTWASRGTVSPSRRQQTEFRSMALPGTRTSSDQAHRAPALRARSTGRDDITGTTVYSDLLAAPHRRPSRRWTRPSVLPSHCQPPRQGGTQLLCVPQAYEWLGQTQYEARTRTQ